ncbi:MAG: outer membrane beta-barrel domain-containing protein [Bdellovibrionota bacterium]
MNLRLEIILSNLLLLAMWSPLAMAQDVDTEELNIIELELEKTTTSKPSEIKNETVIKPEVSSAGEFSELGGLAPFAEVSVIQKRFMPKTGRFQFFTGLSLTTNDPFYNTTGLAFKGSYFLTEAWGVELSYFMMSSSEARSTKELLEIQSIGTDSLAYTKNYLGLSILYVPIYGKMAMFNEKIIPFDFYFGLGTGNTKTQAKDGVGTLHVSTGQIFAVTKSFALRWDFSWNFFSAKAVNEDGMINNLFLSLGASFFFPEASYR